MHILKASIAKVQVLYSLYIGSFIHTLIFHSLHEPLILLSSVVVDLICITQYLLIVELCVDLSSNFVLEPLVKVLIFTRNHWVWFESPRIQLVVGLS